MKIIVSNASGDPIYEQIVKQVKGQIIDGSLSPGSGLPSIRNLARDLQISVITTKRAYDELEKAGFIDTVGGKGTYVAEQNRELLREMRMKIVEEKLSEAASEARLIGLTMDELLQMVQLLYEEDE